MVLSLIGMIIVYATTWVSRTSISPSEANSRLNTPKFEANGRWDSVEAFVDLHWPGQGTEFGAMSWPLTFVVVLAFLGTITELVRFGAGARHARLLIASVVSWVSWAIIMNYGLPIMVPQYVMLGAFFFAAFVAAGLDLLRLNLAESLPPGMISYRQPLGVAALFLILIPAVSSSYSAGQDLHELSDARYTVLRTGSRAAGQELGEDCVLLSGSSAQVGYYSGCAVTTVGVFDGDRDTAISTTQLRLNQVAAVEDVGRVGIVSLNGGKRQMSAETLATIDDLLIPFVVDIGTDADGGRLHLWVDEVVLCAPGQILCEE
jgi:hypothetical protein